MERQFLTYYDHFWNQLCKFFDVIVEDDCSGIKIVKGVIIKDHTDRWTRVLEELGLTAYDENGKVVGTGESELIEWLRDSVYNVSVFFNDRRFGLSFIKSLNKHFHDVMDH